MRGILCTIQLRGQHEESTIIFLQQNREQHWSNGWCQWGWFLSASRYRLVLALDFRHDLGWDNAFQVTETDELRDRTISWWLEKAHEGLIVIHFCLFDTSAHSFFVLIRYRSYACCQLFRFVLGSHSMLHSSHNFHHLLANKSHLKPNEKYIVYSNIQLYIYRQPELIPTISIFGGLFIFTRHISPWFGRCAIHSERLRFRAVSLEKSSEGQLNGLRVDSKTPAVSGFPKCPGKFLGQLPGLFC